MDLSELVPSDLVMLAAGGRVLANGELIEIARLAFAEARLTGESEPVIGDHFWGSSPPVAGCGGGQVVQPLIHGR